MNIEFLVTSLVIVVSPGTGALYTVSTGLSGGIRSGLVAAVGCTLGIIPHMIAATTGVAAIFHSNALAFEGLKYAGVAYLLYMAWNTLREQGAFQVEGHQATQPSLQIIRKAILINLLNPKLPMFFLAFLPQFVAANEPAPLARMLVLSAIFMLMTLVVFAFYGAFAAFMRGHLLSRPDILGWLRRAFAASFVALGIKLMLSRR